MAGREILIVVSYFMAQGSDKTDKVWGSGDIPFAEELRSLHPQSKLQQRHTHRPHDMAIHIMAQRHSPLVFTLQKFRHRHQRISRSSEITQQRTILPQRKIPPAPFAHNYFARRHLGRQIHLENSPVASIRITTSFDLYTERGEMLPWEGGGNYELFYE